VMTALAMAALAPAALKDPEFVKRLETEGAVPVGNSPAEFDAYVRSEIVQWGKLIRDARIEMK